MPVQSTCPGGQGFPTVRPQHDTRALELPRNEASQQGEMWHHRSLHKDSRFCPAGLPSPYLQRLASLPSDLIPSTLPWAHCFSYNRSLLLFKQSGSLLPQELCISCSLCLVFSFSWLSTGFTPSSPSGLYSNDTSSVMPSVLSKIAVLLYPYIQREEFCLNHHCILRLKEYMAQSKVCNGYLWNERVNHSPSDSFTYICTEK